MNIGDLTRSMISSTPVDATSVRYNEIKKSIIRFPGEAIYIYSFKESRMVYAEGWNEILGYDDLAISMLDIVSITTPEYIHFSNELNDASLRFISTIKEDLESYGFTLEVKKFHKNGSEVPLFSNVGIFKSENGQMTEIIGRSIVNPRLKFGKVMQFSTYGPFKDGFDEFLNKTLFGQLYITDKEKEALVLVADGKSFKEVAALLNISHSAVEKRILPLYARFGVKSLPHLINFAHKNHILY